MPVKVNTGAHFHDPARDPRSLSSGDLHLGGCARLSKDAGSLMQFQKRRQDLIGVHNEPPSTVAVRVNSPDRSPFKIQN